MSAKKILVGAAIGVPLAVAAYARWIRPWHLQWGVEEDEAHRPLPGDELVPNAKMVATHAITIHAAPARVWPWLVQMGQGRGGFYSYTWLENLVGCQMQNAGRVLPELQQLRVGDPIWLHPNAAPMEVRLLEKDKWLVYYGGRDAFADYGERFARNVDSSFASSWAFVLEDQGPEGCRLLVRNRSTFGPGMQQELAVRCVLEPAHFLMERKLLKTLKTLVEGEQSGWLTRPEDDELSPMFL